MTRRYYVPGLPQSGGLVDLPDAEAQHATRVMRVTVDDAVTLFDGKGRESEASVHAVGRNACQCVAEPSIEVDREPSRAIHLGIALPKPDRARELIERLTELGVKSVTPLIAERSQRPPSTSMLEKLRRGVIEACKQSGRNQLLEILETQSSEDYFTANHDGVRLIAHPSINARPLRRIEEAGAIRVAIGPEGGWTDAETQLAIQHEFVPVDLGARVYRIETAATVIASVLLH